MLKGMASSKIELLRKRLDDLGNVFEFVTIALDRDVSPDEGMHRCALAELYVQIMGSQREWHQKVIRRLPVAIYPEPTMRWNLDDAVGGALGRLQITNLLRTDTDDIGSPTLCGDFIRSLYFPDLVDRAGLGQALFAEWINTLGLVDQSDIVVLNWVDKPTQSLMGRYGESAGATAWTDFFALNVGLGDLGA
ncbi:hypothetical protein I5P86_04420 [Pseudomonas glycinae]|uniref:hypothetical protein n=1 Tax=Pseudomonas glycinae TaxID=1785145 RepID=UPI0018D9331C|nr:hypothetical protein [Pseudomonas glycinae]MBH3404292.1 hypothetical protein [Pseudomonas glycinae]